MTDRAMQGSLDSVVTARTGSRTDAIVELYDGCYQRLLGQLYAVTGDLGEAHEAVQEAFVQALAAPWGFGRLEHPEARLREAALHVARHRIRRRAHLDRLLRRATAPPVGPELPADHAAVVAALRRLPPARAEAVALHDLADLPLAEIAELTGVPAGTVRSRLARGRARLAELLAAGNPAPRRPDPTPEERLAGLRDAVRTEVAPAAAEKRVPFARLVGRAAGRRQRRRLVTTVAALAALGGGLVLANPGAPDADPPIPNPHPLPGRSSTLLMESLMFATADHGFATMLRCQGAGYRCAAHARLLRTDDGGRTWTAVPSPADNGPSEQGGVEAVTETGGVVLRVGSIRYASPDGGRHWAVMPDTTFPGPATPAVPPGWTLTFDATGQVVAFDPLTNEQRPLVNQPGPLARPFDRWVGHTAGGRIVLARLSGGGLALAYTDDRGRTWHTLPAPPGRPGMGSRLLADPATERIYLTESDDRWRLLEVWRLDRVGGPWVPVPVPRQVSADPNPGLMIVQMLPDGELVYLLSPPLRTEAGGTRAAPLPKVSLYGATAVLDDLGISAGGTLYHILPPTITAPSGVLAMLVSTDSGLTWTVRQFRP